MSTNTLLNELTLRKLQRTLSRQQEAIKETEHHIDLVKNAIAEDKKKEEQKDLPLQTDKKK